MNLQTVPVIPPEVHGFTVKVGVGTYPPGAERSHRRAMYAELRPSSDRTRERLRRMGRERILGMVPLQSDAVRDILAHRDGQLAEMAATDALREASKLARQVNQ